jgi:hypothetical protein
MKEQFNISSLLLIALLFTFTSCDFEQKESTYSTYEKAKSAGLFDKGWIPSEVKYESMTDILQLTSPDYNTCIFNFTLSKDEIENLKKQLNPTSEKLTTLNGLTIPTNWINSVNKLNHFTFISLVDNKYVFIAIDDIEDKVYGWRKGIEDKPIKNKSIGHQNKEVKKSITIDSKLLIGSWFDTDESALHFTMFVDGTAKSDNMVTLLYEKWRIKGDSLFLTAKSIGNHTSSTDESAYKIIQLDKNTLIVTSGKYYTGKYTRRYPSTNIKEGQKITSPLNIQVNSEGVWFPSEGELGTIEVVDENNKVLNLKGEWGILSILKPKDWNKKGGVLYKTTVKFDPKEAKSGKIIIYSNSGQGEGDEAGISHTFEIPVLF